MSTPVDSSFFVDVADAIGLGNPSIVEKDYYVVQLLLMIASLDLEHHQIVFTGGTALAKSAIKTYRMSEDIDIKLVPNQVFSDLPSLGSKRKVRKVAKKLVESLIEESEIFSTEEKPIVYDEYRYFSFEIRYPQEHQQAPCLRPFIKLEFIESDLLGSYELKNIQSIYSKVLNYAPEVGELASASILEIQAEKLISMIRRTASVARNCERDDDESLIRHIYDTYHIQLSQPSEIKSLAKLVGKAISMDVQRFGNQHQQMVESPLNELRFGLQLLVDDPKFAERYTRYVSPMVYAENPVSWHDALAVFTKLANEVLGNVEFKSN